MKNSGEELDSGSGGYHIPQIGNSDLAEVTLHAKRGVLLLKAVNNGEDFIIDNYICNYRQQDIITEMRGESINRVFPHTKYRGLWNKLQNSWKTGASEQLNCPKRVKGQMVAYWDFDILSMDEKLLLVYTDLGEEIYWNRQLRQSKKNHRELLNIMEEGFAVFEVVSDNMGYPRDYRFIYVNPVFQNHYGRNKESVLGRCVFEDEFAVEQHWLEAFDQVVLSGVPCSFEEYYGKMNNYYELFIFSPGKGMLACMFTDITPKRLAEKALEQEREWLSVVLGSIGEGVIATDTENRVIFMNETASDLLDWSRESASGKHIRDLFRNSEEYMTERGSLGNFGSCHEDVEISDKTINIVRNGVKKILSNSAAPIRDKKGNLRGMVMIIGDITDQVQARERIEYLSYTDSLTGLRNRAYVNYIFSEIDQAQQLPLSLIFGDVNALKLSNDVFGHQQGDNLLVNIARILTQCCRESDVIARWGGDEFIVILPRTDREGAEQVCERIKLACKMSVNDPVRISIALGAATRDSMEQNIKNLFSKAEDRMYSQKILESQELRAEIISGLEKKLWAESDESEEHCHRLQLMACKMADCLELTDVNREGLLMLARLHDIGKLSVPSKILLKAEPLSSLEWEKVKKHSETGYRMAQSISKLRGIAYSILSHHERWDGQGYP